jgi:hypothetical protein
MLAAMHPASSFGQQLVDDPRRREAARGWHGAGYLARGPRIGGHGSGGAVYGLSSFRCSIRQLGEVRRHPVGFTRPDRQRLFASAALRQAD